MQKFLVLFTAFALIFAAVFGTEEMIKTLTEAGLTALFVRMVVGE